VALAYSTAMILWALPVLAWAVHGTIVSFLDILSVVARPFASVLAAAAVASGVRLFYSQAFAPLPRLIMDTSVLLITYLLIMFFVAGEKSFYLDILRGFVTRTPSEGSSPASA
jgi:hypothetical protein